MLSLSIHKAGTLKEPPNGGLQPKRRNEKLFGRKHTRCGRISTHRTDFLEATTVPGFVPFAAAATAAVAGPVLPSVAPASPYYCAEGPFGGSSSFVHSFEVRLAFYWNATGEVPFDYSFPPASYAVGWACGRSSVVRTFEAAASGYSPVALAFEKGASGRCTFASSEAVGVAVAAGRKGAPKFVLQFPSVPVRKREPSLEDSE